ncbi:MAG: hypothetical protein K1W19_03900 [Lachnospiraceae bacterium]|jgi:hypothetical protein|nr:hypothetical protein [Lachnospiraceae bacterium]MCI9369889.1 hypothetical protein [Lachnospiraceae bacterium]
MRKVMNILIPIILTIIYSGVVFYIFIPAINIHNIGMWIFLISIAVVYAICSYAASMTVYERRRKFPKTTTAALIVVGISVAVCAVGMLVSVQIFRAKAYVNRITVEEGDFDTDVPTLSDIKKIPLMDTASATILGDRVVGSLTDLVSQYDVSDTYTTIYYKGRVVKVAPLEYDGFFKYFNNKKDGVPGYVLVDTETNEAEFVRLEKGMNYSPSGYFSKDLMRAFRMKYPTKVFGDYSFQIDENGVPYWVISCMSFHTFFGCTVPEEAILMNAITGEMELYSMSEIPEWVDYVYSGDEICDLYNSYGSLQKGFINSVIGQKGCTMTTDDFGYVAMNDDIYVYTGITSIVSDKSNLGFLLVNSRTGDFRYYEQEGAEEHSAMDAAEGVVQNYGYTASFPALININGEPTYAMALKDSKGLVKQYAMVNVKNYTIVAVGDTMSETLKNYRNSMGSAGQGIDIKLDVDYNERKITIEDIQFINTNSGTVVYIKSDNKVYKQYFEENESLILLNTGDKITVQYDASEEENDIIEIFGFELSADKEMTGTDAKS